MHQMITGTIAILPILFASQSPAQIAFERLKKLEGEWISKDADTNDQPMKVTFKLTGARTTLVETQFPGEPHEMMTTYHLDGNNLVLTHYCAAGNQPRMKLIPGKDANRLVFQFTGISNLANKNAGHIHSAKYHFQGPDSFVSEWEHWADNKSGGWVKFDMKRVRPSK